MKKAKGFTIIELMIAVALIGVLLSVAAPSFVDIIARNNLTAKNNLMVSSLQLARSEAVRRGKTVTVCKSTDGVNCSTTAGVGYDDGWIVFVEQSSTVHPIGSRDTANEDLLKVQEAFGESYTLRGNTPFVNYISYLSSGALVNSSQGYLVLCKDNDLTYAKAIFMLTTGRVHSAGDSNGNHIPENESGSDMTSCS